MSKCWKVQEDTLILVWIIAEWSDICCNNRPPLSNWCWCLPRGGLLLQQIFSLLALNQTWIKISVWNFQDLFIWCLRKFEKKILAVAQSACQPRPILAETLDASSNHICWDVLKRKKIVRFWTHWSSLLKGLLSLKKWHSEIFWTSSKSSFMMSTLNLLDYPNFLPSE